MPSQFIDTPYAAFLVIGWLAFGIGASVMWRIKRGKPLIVRIPPNARYVERTASGRSLRPAWRQIGGAGNCITVIVTADELIVSPILPFNLMFLPEVWGLEGRARRSEIRSVEMRNGLFGRAVTVRADAFEFELRLRDPEAFIKALQG